MFCSTPELRCKREIVFFEGKSGYCFQYMKRPATVVTLPEEGQALIVPLMGSHVLALRTGDIPKTAMRERRVPTILDLLIEGETLFMQSSRRYENRLGA